MNPSLWKWFDCKSSRTCVLSTYFSLFTVAALQAGDEWSPGATNDSWQRISKLQSVHATARVRSAFVTQCCTSSELVERLAAISWIARTRSSTHIPELELLLADEVMVVRLFAYKAIQTFHHQDALALTFRYADKLPSQSSALQMIGGDVNTVSGGLGMGSTNSPFLLPIQNLSSNSKQDWLSHSFDHSEWINELNELIKNSKNARGGIKIPKSVFERDDLIGVISDTDSKSNGTDVYVGEMKEMRGQETYLRLKYDHSEQNVHFFGVQSDRSLIVPGVYAVKILSRNPGMQMAGSAFPFFVRINRSKGDEEDLGDLLQNINSLKTIERISELRAREAAPQLIELYQTATDCERLNIGKALSRIGDGRAAKVILEQSPPNCSNYFDFSLDIGSWLRAFDNASQSAYMDQIRESAKPASKLTRAEFYARTNRLRLALTYLQRPLAPEQSQRIGEFLHERIREVAKEDNNEEKYSYEAQLAGVIHAACGDDSLMMVEWLKRIENFPDLYLRVIEQQWPAPSFERSREYKQAMNKEIEQWLGTVQLQPHQAEIATAKLKQMKRELAQGIVAPRSVWSSKEFGREYFLDDCRQFWSVQDGKPELWGTFCRELRKLLLIDADTLCVLSESCSIQVVRRGSKVRAWSASQLFGEHDSARNRKGQICVGVVGDYLVVATQSTFVFVVPLYVDNEPWCVPDPQVLEPLAPDALDKENPFGVDPELASKPIRRGKQTPMSGVPNVWKLGSNILIDNVGEIGFAIQCVDLKEQKVLWERQRNSINLRKMVEDEGWTPITY